MGALDYIGDLPYRSINFGAPRSFPSSWPRLDPSGKVGIQSFPTWNPGCDWGAQCTYTAHHGRWTTYDLFILISSLALSL